MTQNPPTRTVDINFQLVEGERVFVERIDISGNDPDPRPGHPPPVPPRRGRRLQLARDPRRRGPHPGARLLQGGKRQCPRGQWPRLCARQRPGRGTADRQPQPRWRLFDDRGLFGTGQPDRAQLPRPRPDGHGARSRRRTSSPTTSSASTNRRSSTAISWPASRSSTADRNFEEQSFSTSTVGIEPRIGFPLSENGRLTRALPHLAGQHLRRPGRHLADHRGRAGQADHVGDRADLRLRPPQLRRRSDRRLHPDAEPGVRRPRRRRHPLQDAGYGAGLHQLLRRGPRGVGRARGRPAHLEGRNPHHRPLQHRRRQLPRLRAQRSRTARLSAAIPAR